MTNFKQLIGRNVVCIKEDYFFWELGDVIHISYAEECGENIKFHMSKITNGKGQPIPTRIGYNSDLKHFWTIYKIHNKG